MGEPSLQQRLAAVCPDLAAAIDRPRRIILFVIVCAGLFTAALAIGR